MTRAWIARACLVALVIILQVQSGSGIPTSAGSRGSLEVWVGRHPEAEEVAKILRRLRKRLEKEGREAREQVLCFA